MTHFCCSRFAAPDQDPAADHGSPSFALPGARPHYGQDRTCDVRHLRLDITVDLEDKLLEGTCSLTLLPLLDDTREVELDAVDLEVSAVTQGGSVGAGTPLAFHRTDGKLRIQLAGPCPAGQPIQVAVRYQTRPRRGLYFVEPDAGYPDRPRQAWSQGQDEDARAWFPCIDHPGVKSTSEVVATVKAPYRALSNGLLQAETPDPARGTCTYHWLHDVPHAAYLVTLVVGDYVRHAETTPEGVLLETYVPPGRETDIPRVFGRTAAMVKLFSERTGMPYPYRRYAQVVVSEFIFGGMENTTQTTLTDDAMYDERAGLDFHSDALIAHELAHQWFGDLLTCRDWTEAWLNEGFATYFEAVWREQDEGLDERDHGLQDDAESYFAEDSERYRRPVVTHTFHQPIELFDRHLYEKGAWILHMLRALLGEAAFWKSIRHYVAKHSRQAVVTADLARAIDEVTGRRLDWFFEQWVHRGGIPELKAEVAWDEAKHLLKIALVQTQKRDQMTPVFRLPIEVRIVTGGGVAASEGQPASPDSAEERTVVMEDAEQTFFLPLATAPRDVLIDPRNVLLKRLVLDKPPEMWRAQLASAREAIARTRAAEALAKMADHAAIEALGQGLVQDVFWATRAACARGLGQVRGEAALGHLLARLRNEPHPKARRAIVRALGAFRHDPRAGAAVQALFERGDPSYFVEGESLLALGRLRVPSALDVIRAGVEARRSFLEIIASQGVDGLGELGDRRAIEFLLEHARYGRPTRVRRAAVLALGRLADLAEERGRLVDDLSRLLDDPDFRLRMAVADALERAADPRAAGALQRALGRELDGRASRRYREVLRGLESGQAQGSALRRLRDEVSTLRDEQVKLRERLTAVEARLGVPLPEKT